MLVPWSSDFIRLVIVGSAIPGGLVILAIVWSLARTLPLPKHILVLGRPFRDFLQLEDLHEQHGELLFVPLWKNRALISISILSSAIWMSAPPYMAVAGDRWGALRAAVQSASWAAIALRLAIIPPVTPPYIPIVFALTSTVAKSIDLYYDIRGWSINGAIIFDIALAALFSVFIWVAGTYPLQVKMPSTNVAENNDIPSDKLTMPEDFVTLWTWCNFSFVEPILAAASMKRLDDSDVWRLSPYFKHKNLFTKWIDYRKRYPTHSVLRFLLASNSLDLIIDVSLELYTAFAGFIPPYALQTILASLNSEAPGARVTAFKWTVITFLAHLSYAQKDLWQSWHTRRCYERTRGQLFCALHWKALMRQDVSGKVATDNNETDGKQNADLGKIVNLMQGDAYAVSQRFWEFSGIFSSPIKLVIAMVFLYNVLGWSALAGVAVLLLSMLLNYPLAKYNIHITRQSWKAKDSRMNTVNELLQNIRFLKFYGWENHWAQKSREGRERELSWRVKENIVSTFISFIWTWVPSATALAAFTCYTVVAKQQLTVDKAFTAVALFSQLQGPMTDLPGQIFAMLHAYVSMQRIEEFLAEPEVPDWASSLKASAEMFEAGEKVAFESASFEWHGLPSDSSANLTAQFLLGPLNIEFRENELTLITGPTGSGKSAVLAALLGEMNCLSGKVHLNKFGHKVAFCAQNPWLEHATIRDNIIFGSEFGYDEARYDAVVEACALVKDLDALDAGDETEIGEKGITMSGGQRARIALARAMYSQATVILLDDPLAAVDMHTAQHIVTHCLSGDLAKGRTIILVTHHVRMCLSAASYIVELTKGRVSRQGLISEFSDLGELDEVLEAEDEPFEELAPPEDQENEADIESRRNTQVVEPKKRVSNGKLIEAEARAEGRVSFRTYWTYIKAAGIFSWVLTIILLLLIRVINIGNQFYLAKWGEAYNQPALLNLTYSHLLAYSDDSWNLPPPAVNVRPWIFIYFLISLCGAIVVLLYIALGYYASLQASRTLFLQLLNRLVRAPARFFDVTPIGRILNRFTTDINTVDGALQNSARAALSGVFNFIASFIVIVAVVPSFAPFALIIAGLYIRLAPRYIRASRDLRRLESVSLSPAFAGFDELLRGLPHVRAFAMESRYQDRFYERVDTFQTFDHVYWLVSGWLRWRYDCLGSVVVFLTTSFALLNHTKSGLAAVVIVQAGIFAEASRQLVRVLAQMELDFNSVERIVEYPGVPQEAPPVIEKSRPPAYWPSSSGTVVFEDFAVRYAENLPVILKNLSFTVKPAEKIGIVGRTGSGKSTLALSLLRMVEAYKGKIIIDGIDISGIGLEDLRTKITIVSQDVSLFSGTLRSNLDPFQEHTDQECWDVLDRCHLTNLLRRSADDGRPQDVSLDMLISQGGSLSAGERQLVSLARAVLRRTNIIILDEATSQIDSRLDDQIQKTIREELSGALVITIAHRLKTIIDYDRVLVLDAGEVREFDSPATLIRQEGSAFREMCKRSADWSLLVAAVDNKTV